jgi:hypothetical protein
MKLYIASDGWPFYLQDDGTLTDTPNPNQSDLGWNTLKDLTDWDEDTRLATDEEFEEWQDSHAMAGLEYIVRG